MPIVAGDLNEAIANTNGQVSSQFSNAGRLSFYISTFNDLDSAVGWPSNFDPGNQNERTVRNWYVEAKIIEDATPAAGIGTPLEAQEVVNVACRVMYAARAAEAAGRITTAQRDAVLDAWNNSFGSVP